MILEMPDSSKGKMMRRKMKMKMKVIMIRG